MKPSSEFSDGFNSILEAYLDGRLEPSASVAFERELRNRPDLQEAVRIEQRMRESLRQSFVPPSIGQNEIVELIRSIESPAARSAETSVHPRQAWLSVKWLGAPRQWLQVFALGSLAAVVWTVVLWQASGHRTNLPSFTPEPLVAVHLRSVADGFRPYYICDDPPRFTMTFASRQGVPLRLKELPGGTKMLGISYLGGLSRSTTVMLGTSAGKEISVFVDRRQDDISQPQFAAESGLHVYRKELDALVLYEVSPLEHPVFLDAFEVTDPVDCTPGAMPK